MQNTEEADIELEWPLSPEILFRCTGLQAGRRPKPPSVAFHQMGPSPLLLLVTLSNTTSKCEKAWQPGLVHSKHPRCGKDKSMPIQQHQEPKQSSLGSHQAASVTLQLLISEQVRNQGLPVPETGTNLDASITEERRDLRHSTCAQRYSVNSSQALSLQMESSLGFWNGALARGSFRSREDLIMVSFPLTLLGCSQVPFPMTTSRDRDQHHHQPQEGRRRSLRISPRLLFPVLHQGPGRTRSPPVLLLGKRPSLLSLSMGLAGGAAFRRMAGRGRRGRC